MSLYYVKGDSVPTVEISVESAAAIWDVAKSHDFNRIRTIKAVRQIRSAGGELANLKECVDLCDCVMKHQRASWATHQPDPEVALQRRDDQRGLLTIGGRYSVNGDELVRVG